MIYLVDQGKSSITCFCGHLKIEILLEENIALIDEKGKISTLMGEYDSLSDCKKVLELLAKKIKLGESIFEFPTQEYVNKFLNDKG